LEGLAQSWARLEQELLQVLELLHVLVLQVLVLQVLVLA